LPAPLQGRPLAWLLLALTAGIALAELLRPAPGLALLLLALCGLAALYCLYRDYRPLAALLICAVALGFYLCAGQRAALDAWPGEDGERATVEGRMLGAAERRDQDRYRFRLRVETFNGAPLNCAPIYVYGEGEPPRAGSRVAVSGEVYQPSAPGNPRAFDYGAYLHYQGIAGSVSAYFGGEVAVLETGPSLSLARLGDWLRQRLNAAAANLSVARRALVLGVFLGDKSGLDYPMKNALGLAGMLHAFAVSGLNVGFIVALALALVGKGYRKRWQRLWLILILLLAYIAMTGASASILRAALMVLTLLLADVLAEQNDTVSALSLSALICLAFKPLWLLDPGFQLSYAAVLGILIYYPAFRGLLRPWHRLLRDSYAVTWASTLFTLPLVSYYYWHISWLGWLPAPLVAGAVGVTVVLGFAASLLALFWPFAAGLLLEAAGWIMELTYRLGAWLVQWPGAATISGALPLWYVAIFMALLLALPLLKRLRPARLLTGAALLLTLLFSLLPALGKAPALSWREDVLAEAVFLDVGQGDAALIRTRDGLNILIDGGGTGSGGAVGEYILLPYLKSRGVAAVDVMISSHPDQDHIDGLLSVLDNLPVRTLIVGSGWPEQGLQAQLLARARQNGAELLEAAAGDAYRLGDTLKLTVYSPPEGARSSGDAEDNDYSLVCEISCGETDMLFTGDAGGELLSRLADTYDIEAEIVKLPHHGSKTGYSLDFYQGCRAKAAIISVGADNSYGHPAAGVVEYWQEQGGLYRTDEQGAVTVRLTARDYTVETGE